MFDIIHKHYHSGDNKSETGIINAMKNITTVPNDPFCQRCEHRHSYHNTKCGFEDCDCICFISTGSLMLPHNLTKGESKI